MASVKAWRALLDLNKAHSLQQKLQILRRLRPRDLLPVPPAVAEYSTGLRMGATAEQMAKSHGISREAQDALALRSHQHAAKALQSGVLQQEVMVAFVPPWKKPIDQDNNVRMDAKAEDYTRLRPVFDRQHGSVTAANSTPLTDGVAAVILMREGRARELNLQPLGYLRSYAFTAIGIQQDMLLGPTYASPLVLDRAGITLDDLTLIDMHEAFAAQTLTNLQLFRDERFARDVLNRLHALGEVNEERFNVLGGRIDCLRPSFRRDRRADDHSDAE